MRLSNFKLMAYRQERSNGIAAREALRFVRMLSEGYEIRNDRRVGIVRSAVRDFRIFKNDGHPSRAAWQHAYSRARRAATWRAYNTTNY